jgi:hypothetical protein
VFIFARSADILGVCNISRGLKMDLKKVRGIVELPTPRSTFQVRRFHDIREKTH